jgi:peptide deformylase
MLYTVADSKNLLSSMCSDVSDFDVEVKPFLEEAFRVMSDYGGVAVAAPQIGVLYNWYLDYHGIVYMNPLLISRKEKVRKREQCLSVPNVTVIKDRFEHVTLQFVDLRGDTKIVSMSGLDAQIAQHEIDHLLGKLICDGVDVENFFDEMT